MGKKFDIVESDDGSVDVNLDDKSGVSSSEQYEDTGGGNLVNKETGESAFDDITPVDKRRKPVDKDEADEQEDTEDEDKPSRKADEDDSDLTDNMRKRVARERRLREEDRAENEELRERLAKLEGSYKELTDKDALAKDKAEADTKLSDLRTQLKAAKENGDTDLEIELSDKITDLRVDIRAKELAVKTAKKVVDDAPKSIRSVKLTRQWLRKHSRYNRDAEFKALVDVIDRSVAADGFDPDSDEYYEEVDKRVRKRFPEEYKDEGGERRRGNQPPTRSDRGSSRESAGNDRDEDSSFKKVGKNTYRLSKGQLANMERFGMDPRNPADVKSYVQNNLS